MHDRCPRTQRADTCSRHRMELTMLVWHPSLTATWARYSTQIEPRIEASRLSARGRISLASRERLQRRQADTISGHLGKPVRATEGRRRNRILRTERTTPNRDEERQTSSRRRAIRRPCWHTSPLGCEGAIEVRRTMTDHTPISEVPTESPDNLLAVQRGNRIPVVRAPSARVEDGSRAHVHAGGRPSSDPSCEWP